MGKFTIGDYICGIVVTLLDECESWFIITQYILMVEGLLFFISVLVVLAKIGLDRIGNNYQLCYEVLEEAGSLFNYQILCFSVRTRHCKTETAFRIVFLPLFLKIFSNDRRSVQSKIFLIFKCSQYKSLILLLWH